VDKCLELTLRHGAEQVRAYYITNEPSPNPDLARPNIGADEGEYADRCDSELFEDGSTVRRVLPTGTDEHGHQMLQTGAKEEAAPRELSERNRPRFKAIVERRKLLEKSGGTRMPRATEAATTSSSEGLFGQRMEGGAACYIYLEQGGDPGAGTHGVDY